MNIAKLHKRAKLIRQLLREKWVERKLGVDPKKRTHPVIIMLRNYDEFCSRKTANKEIPSLLRRFYALGDYFEILKDSEGFNSRISDLKRIEKFEDTFFEIEVAAFYKRAGFVVAFIETDKHKTAELKICKNKVTGFVECKNKEHLSVRDRKTENLWKQAKIRLLKLREELKICMAVLIEALSELEEQDVKELLASIEEDIKRNDYYDSLKQRKFIPKRLKNIFKYCIVKLAHWNEEVESNQVFWSSSVQYDLQEIGFSSRRTTEGKVLIKNPYALMFKYFKKPDRVSGAINSFRAAKKQLPKRGPGAIFIKLPNYDEQITLESDIKIIRDDIERELRENYNRRVNTVVLLPRLAAYERTKGERKMVYVNCPVIINHRNPKTIFEFFSVNWFEEIDKKELFR